MSSCILDEDCHETLITSEQWEAHHIYDSGHTDGVGDGFALGLTAMSVLILVFIIGKLTAGLK